MNKQRGSIVFILMCSFFMFMTPTMSFAKKEQMYRVPKSKSGSLIIYKNPTTHSRIVKRLPANTRWIAKLPGIKKYSRETWLQVSWNDTRGWVKKSRLVFDAKATNMVAKNPRCKNKKTRSKSCGSS